MVLVPVLDRRHANRKTASYYRRHLAHMPIYGPLGPDLHSNVPNEASLGAPTVPNNRPLKARHGPRASALHHYVMHGRLLFACALSGAESPSEIFKVLAAARTSLRHLGTSAN